MRRIAVLILLLAVGVADNSRAQSRLVINEIMFAPVSPEPEWIELWNTSSDSIDISGWSFTVGKYNPRIIPVGTRPIAAGEMVALCAKDSILSVTRLVPRSQILYAPLNQLTNTGTSISLRDTGDKSIDSVAYDGSWIPKNGISIERIDWREPGYVASNWKCSEDTSGATLLRPNSVRKRGHDLGIAGVNATDSIVDITIINCGSDTFRGACVRLHVNEDSVERDISATLLPGDSLIKRVALPQDFYGAFDATALLCDDADERHANDTLRFRVSRPIPADSLVINEIMFQPAVNDCQWIELVNASTRRISLDSLTLSTGQSRPGIYNFTIGSVLMKPGDYALIAANDSVRTAHPVAARSSAVFSLGRSSLGLGKDSCYVVLHNQDGSAIDSVHYLGSWQHSLVREDFTGISLERRSIDRPSNSEDNWQASFDTSGSTSLAPNSNSMVAIPTTPASEVFSASFEPNPFSPDGDGFEDESMLSVQLTDDAEWAVRVRLYDDRGRMVRTIADAQELYHATTIHFDGRRDNGQTLTPGLYTALIEVSAQNPTRALRKAIAVAIAGKRK